MITIATQLCLKPRWIYAECFAQSKVLHAYGRYDKTAIFQRVQCATFLITVSVMKLIFTQLSLKRNVSVVQHQLLCVRIRTADALEPEDLSRVRTQEALQVAELLSKEQVSSQHVY